jgi:hypothetical protein
MSMVRSALVGCALVTFAAAASAGPIPWSYSSSGGQNGQYQIDPGSIPFMTLSGQSQDIYLIGGVHFPLVPAGSPPQGPTVWDEVTIFDTQSGRMGMFSVPIQFTGPVPSQVNGWYQYDPHVGPIAPVNLFLGEHKYTITNGPDHGLTVTVVTTPEPTALMLAAVGIGCVGLVRRRRVARAGVGR